MYSEVSQNCVVGARVRTYRINAPRETHAAIKYGGFTAFAGVVTACSSWRVAGVARLGYVVVIGPNNLVTELPHTGQDHGKVVLVRRRNHLGVLDRSSGLDDGGNPSRGGLVHAVPKGKEGVAREHRALGVVPLLPG